MVCLTAGKELNGFLKDNLQQTVGHRAVTVLNVKHMSAVFSICFCLGDIPEELDIEELKQRAKNGDSKAQTEVRITRMRACTCTLVCKIQIRTKIRVRCFLIAIILSN